MMKLDNRIQEIGVEESRGPEVWGLNERSGKEMEEFPLFFLCFFFCLIIGKERKYIILVYNNLSGSVEKCCLALTSHLGDMTTDTSLIIGIFTQIAHPIIYSLHM